VSSILIIGNGGREHALAKQLNDNTRVEQIYCSPGNGGTAILDKCSNIPFENLESLAQWALEKKVDLTIPGPEAYLCEGAVDIFKAKDLRIFGPDKKSAMLEGSKAFAKDFMARYGVKTAAYKRYDKAEKAMQSLDQWSYPLVVKADGLAAGKGVIICADQKDAVKAIEDIMVDKQFGGAGSEIVIEEFLEGKEASILSFFDGKRIVPMMSAKDHKKIGEGETGLNTGGMGVISPNPWVDEKVWALFEKDIMEPTLKGLLEEKLIFPGIIFFGLMINSKGVFLLEYNLRFGDPEVQTLLPMLKTDLLDLFNKSIDGQIDQLPMEWKPGHSCCVVMASGGYPGAYKKNYVISNWDNLESHVYFAGAEFDGKNIITSGGRVLAVVANGDTLEEARKKAYRDIEKIHFTDAYYRKDIGL